MGTIQSRHQRVAVVVEDHALLRKRIARLVGRTTKAIACATYEEAIDVIDKLSVPPLALIVDVMLGSAHGDGLMIAEHAHKRFGRHVPTLVLTGSEDIAGITERAQRLRAEFLVKPQNDAALELFVQRATVVEAWDVPDVIDLDRALDRFAHDHKLTARQRQLLMLMMGAAERGERAEINTNTRKAGLRRILARTGHATFRDLRSAIKRLAAGRDSTSCAPGS